MSAMAVCVNYRVSNGYPRLNRRVSRAERSRAAPLAATTVRRITTRLVSRMGIACRRALTRRVLLEAVLRIALLE
jgi:hypothetical protein